LVCPATPGACALSLHDALPIYGRLGIRRWFESKRTPGEKLTVDEYYAHIFDHSVPGLPERAAGEGLAPLEFMRRYSSTVSFSPRSEEHTSELQSPDHLVCRLLL